MRVARLGELCSRADRWGQGGGDITSGSGSEPHLPFW